ESMRAMRTELERLLQPVGLDVFWKDLRSKTGEDFQFVVVGSFDGSCAASNAPSAPALAGDNSSSLADTSISDGRILPFFHIDCEKVVRMLGGHPDGGMLGRALARVIAHELYHIIGNTKNHHDTGVAKAVFSLKDLTTPRFELDMWSVAQMKPQRTSDHPEL